MTSSIVLQKAKLKTVLDKIDKLLHIPSDEPDRKWTLECKERERERERERDKVICNKREGC